MEKIDEYQVVMISIVMTVYNHEKYLSRALESILCQNISCLYQIVIGDDASTDKSASIILDYAKKHPGIIVPVIREVNIGGAKNFTDLVRRCNGKYIMFVDGDDFWIDRNKLQVQLDYLEKNPNRFHVSHKVEVRDVNEDVIGTVPGKKFERKIIKMEDVLSGRRFALTATMIRSIEVCELERLLSLVEIGPRNAGDLTIALFLLDRGPIPILDKVMSVYFFREISGETNYNSITKLTKKLHNRILMISINDKYYSGKYYFGWLYARLLASTMRGLTHGRSKEFVGLLVLIYKISIIFSKSTIAYGYRKNKMWCKVETDK